MLRLAPIRQILLLIPRKYALESRLGVGHRSDSFEATTNNSFYDEQHHLPLPIRTPNATAYVYSVAIAGPKSHGKDTWVTATVNPYPTSSATYIGII
jgi:hypothetical protein